MPSRRRQKALRDKNITHNFFSQGEPSTCSSSAEQSPSNATSLKASAKLDASMYSLKKSLIETDHRTGAEKLRTRMSALWQEKYNDLATEEAEEIHTAIETLPTILDPRSVVQGLNLAHKQIKDALSTTGVLPETFDLASLDPVAEEYDGLCKWYGLRGENQMASQAERISKLASTAECETCSTEDRLAAELDITNLNIDSKIRVPLISCLRQVQLFNMEKKFGFVAESYQALSTEDGRKPGEDVPTELQPSFRQKLNDPFKVTEPAPKSRQKKGEKKLSALEALTQLQLNLKLASEEIQDLKAINDTQDFEELPCVTPTSTYADVAIPEGIPDHVRQRFLDADFALEQMAVLVDEVKEQRLKVRSALLAWSSASQEVWYVHFEAITPIELVDRMP